MGPFIGALFCAGCAGLLVAANGHPLVPLSMLVRGRVRVVLSYRVLTVSCPFCFHIASFLCSASTVSLQLLNSSMDLYHFHVQRQCRLWPLPFTCFLSDTQLSSLPSCLQYLSLRALKEEMPLSFIAEV